jgi:hypothetical protein
MADQSVDGSFFLQQLFYHLTSLGAERIQQEAVMSI